MLEFISPAITTIAAALIPGAIYYSNHNRARPIEYPLKPNCLLTRHPIVFVSGMRSILYYKSYWNQLPNFLSQHGFEVFELDLPWRSDSLRKRTLHRSLKMLEQENTGYKVHLVIDESSQRIVEELYREHHYNNVVSTTLIANIESSLAVSSGVNSRVVPKPLKQPIEEITVIPEPRISPLWWMHRFWSNTPTRNPLSIGYGKHEDVQALQSTLLDQMILLAERDFTSDKSPIDSSIENTAAQDSQQGNTGHDATFEIRPFRDQNSDSDLPSPSC